MKNKETPSIEELEKKINDLEEKIKTRNKNTDRLDEILHELKAERARRLTFTSQFSIKKEEQT